MTSADQRLRKLIVKQHPWFPISSFEILGEGLDNIAAEVNGDVIIRFAKKSGGKIAIQKEVQLLKLLAGIGSVEIPVPIAELSGENYYSYSKIQGLPLIFAIDQMADADLSSICSTLGGFLSELHAISPKRLKDLIPFDSEPFEELLFEAKNNFELAKDLVPEEAHAGVRDFFGSALPKAPANITIIHNDLGIEHLIVNSGNSKRLGVIDWSDAAIGDPAVDFSRIYRDFGAERLNQVFRRYTLPPESIEEITKRVIFYARCSIFEEFAYGRALGHEIYLIQG